MLTRSSLCGRRLVWFLAVALGGCGCSHPAVASPGPRQPAPGEREATPAERDDASEDEQLDARLERLVADLGRKDPRRVWYAAVELLRDRAAGRASAAAIRAIGDALERGDAEHKRTIVNAIGRFSEIPDTPIRRPITAELVPLLRPFLTGEDDALRREAIEALVTLNGLELDRGGPGAVKALLDELLRGGGDPRATIAAVEIVGRMPPKLAVPKLIEVLRRFRLPSQAGIRAAALGQLYEVTGNRFRSRQEAEAWWKANRDRLPEQWFRERLRKAEAEAARARGVALRWWKRHIEAQTADREALEKLLIESLAEEVPEIRAEAARRLAKLGSKPGYERLIATLETERDPDVLAALLEALATHPPVDEGLRRKAAAAAQRFLDLNVDRQVRAAAVRALGALGATEAVQRLLAMLDDENLDADLGVAVYEALSRMRGVDTRPVIARIAKWLTDELARPVSERRPRWIEAALKTLTVMARQQQIDPAAASTAAAVAQVARLLEYDNGASATPKVRQLAASALREIGHPAALPALERAMRDPDEAVARFVADAIGAIASQPGVGSEQRLQAVRSLISAYGTARPALRQNVIDALRQILAVEPRAYEPVRAFVARLAEQAKESADFERLVRLLRDLPSDPPEGVSPEIWQALRAQFAEALLRLEPPAAREALEVLGDLARRAPKYRLAFADAMTAAGNAEQALQADTLYGQLLAEGGAPETIWPRRLDVVARLVRLGDRKLADEVARRIRAAQPAPPPEVLEKLDTLLGKRSEESAPARERAGETTGTKAAATPDGSPSETPSGARGGD